MSNSSLDTKHLKWSRWYDRMPATGKLRMKRVSAAKEAQFPKQYREILASGNAAKLVKHLMVEKQLSLSDAWSTVKQMVNN